MLTKADASFKKRIDETALILLTVFPKPRSGFRFSPVPQILSKLNNTDISPGNKDVHLIKKSAFSVIYFDRI